MLIENEQLAMQYTNKEFIRMNNEADSHPMINEPFKPEQNTTSINDKSLSLILSLRINDQFLLQNRTIDYETPIDDRSRIYASSLTCSLTRKPYNALHKIPHLLPNDNNSITPSTNARTPLDERISNLLDIPSSTILDTSSINQLISSTKTAELKNDHISQWIDSQISDKSSIEVNSTTDEMILLPELAEVQKEIVPLTIEMEDSIPLSAKQLEVIERRTHRHQLQREIITIAKKALKPFFKKHYITNDAYKTIMKKVVIKATYSNKIDHKWINKTINAYVKKYRTVQSL